MFENLTNISQDINRATLVLNLISGALLGLLLSYHWKLFSNSLSNKNNFGKILPILIMTITLIISLIKASLALSLGLVGALSIVRFRTPIKDPQELLYLFLAIAIGIGLGAGESLATFLAFTIISIFGILISKKKEIANDQLFCTLSIPSAENFSIDDFSKSMENNVANLNLRHFEKDETGSEYTVLFTTKTKTSTNALINQIQSSIPNNASFNLIDRSDLPLI